MESGGILQELDGGRVDEEVLRLDLGRAHPFQGEDALPEIVRVIERIALVDHREAPTMAGRPALPRQLERVMNDALDALSGVHVFLDRDLVRGPALELATDSDVGALGVFTDDDQVDGPGVAQWRQARGEQA